MRDRCDSLAHRDRNEAVDHATEPATCWRSPSERAAVKLKLEARDAASAVEVVADAVAQVAARVEVGSRLGHLVPKGVAWDTGDSKEYRLRAQTRVQLRSLKTAEHMYDISFAPEDAVVHDGQIFASLASGSRASALTGGSSLKACCCGQLRSQTFRRLTGLPTSSRAHSRGQS